MDDLKSVVAQGDRRLSLIALRDHLAQALIDAEGRDKAPLAKQLADVLEAIDAIPAAREDSVADKLRDDVAAQREKRKAAGRKDA